MNVCRAHSRPKPCPSCQQASRTQRLNWQVEGRQNHHRRMMLRRPETWFDEELEMLREMAGRYSASDIVQRINRLRRTYALSPRSVRALWSRAEVEGIPLGLEHVHAAHRASEVLGVTETTLRVWRKAGWLKGRAWGHFWVYEESEMVRFVTDRPWLVDADRMARGAVRAAAEVANRRDPWLRAAELAKLVPTTAETVLKYAHQGLLDYQQRAGYHGAHMLRASSVARVRELLVAAEASRYRHLKRSKQAA